jgi:hypothetical protein
MVVTMMLSSGASAYVGWPGCVLAGPTMLVLWGVVVIAVGVVFLGDWSWQRSSGDTSAVAVNGGPEMTAASTGLADDHAASVTSLRRFEAGID